jgi:integrase
MGRPRSTKPLRNKTDGRYYVTVYPKAAPKLTRLQRQERGDKGEPEFSPNLSGNPVLYLREKNRKRADQIYRAIRAPLEAGDKPGCIRRRDLAIKILDTRPHAFDEWIESLESQAAFGGTNEDIAEFMEQKYPGWNKEFDDQWDDDRHHVDSIAKHLTALHDTERDDLINELVSTLVEWLDNESAQLLYDGLCERLNEQARDRIAPAAQRLSDCIPVWETFQIKIKQSTSEHINAFKRTFDEFIEHVGNKPVNKLVKDDLRKWRDHIAELREERDNGVCFSNQKQMPIPAILRQVVTDRDWDFPEQLELWFRVFHLEQHNPGEECSEPMELDDYRKALAKAEEWANIDVYEYAANLPIKSANAGMAKANNTKQANRRKRAGTMWSAILRLACNCGCDNQDICNLTPAHLDLDGKLPLFTLSREKQQKQGKKRVPRCTPLLPSTIEAVKRWMDYETPKTQFVFTNDAKKRFVGSKVSNGWTKLREDAGLDQGVWYKLLRNVGPTIARDHGRPEDERLAFLGDKANGISRVNYEGRTKQEFLVPLVNLIGAEYFDGENVGK